jgi:hypothetical protein
VHPLGDAGAVEVEDGDVVIGQIDVGRRGPTHASYREARRHERVGRSAGAVEVEGKGRVPVGERDDDVRQAVSVDVEEVRRVVVH